MGFSRFGLSNQLLQSITQLGYAEPTPIQQQAIPEALKGRDIRACAQTGTGKTCAFMIPIVEHLLIGAPSHHRPTVLILSPTRELAAQIVSVTHGLIKGTRIRTSLILGGVNINHQIRELRSAVDIVVATPGRLLDLLERNSLSLHHVKTFVMDEADRMLDMGFLPDMKRIRAQLPYQRQTMLFSATFGHEIKTLTNEFLKNPVVIEVSPSSTVTSANVTQLIYPVPAGQKRALLQALLELSNMTSALIFTRTKHGANKLMLTIQGWGKKVSVIHSNKSQSARQQALQGFKEKRYQILVATDIAARGIDVKDISHVINYDVPRHAEDYVHRIGRTGRAEAVGEAFTLVSPDEEEFVKKIENFIKKPIPRGVIPDFPYERRPQVFQKPSPRPAHSGHHSHSTHGSQSHRSSHPAPSSGRPNHPPRPPKKHWRRHRHRF